MRAQFEAGEVTREEKRRRARLPVLPGIDDDETACVQALKRHGAATREDEMGPRESTCAVPRFAAIMFNRGAVVWGAGSTRMSARRDFWVWWEHEVEPDDIVPLSAAARMHMRLGGDIHKLRLSFDGKRLVTREET